MFGKPDIEKYFLAEKSAALWLIGLASVFFIAAIIFWVVQKNDFAKGLFIPSVLLLTFALMAGLSIYKGSDIHRKDIVYAFDMNPSKIQQQEIPRIKKLISGMKTYMIVESIVLGAGAILVFLYFDKQSTASFLPGLGWGLVIAGLITLSIETMGGVRTIKYLEGLKSVFLS